MGFPASSRFRLCVFRVKPPFPPMRDERGKWASVDAGEAAEDVAHAGIVGEGAVPQRPGGYWPAWPMSRSMAARAACVSVTTSALVSAFTAMRPRSVFTAASVVASDSAET